MGGHFKIAIISLLRKFFGELGPQLILKTAGCQVVVDRAQVAAVDQGDGGQAQLPVGKVGEGGVGIQSVGAHLHKGKGEQNAHVGIKEQVAGVVGASFHV